MKRYPLIKLDGQSLKSVSTLSYLGLLIDSRLTFQPHVNFLKTKIQRTSHNLSKLAKGTWGLGGTANKQIYKLCIEKVLTYACGAWWKPTKNVHMSNLLESTQRIPLLQLTRAYRTVSTDALQVISGCPPLSFVISEEAALFNLREHGTAEHIHKIFSANVQRPILSCALDPTSLISIPIETFDPSDPSDFHIFTDASKQDDNLSAMAFVVFCNSVEIVQRGYRLPDHTSVFQGEAAAIRQALRWFHENIEGNGEMLTVVSDSRSVLRALENPLTCDPLIHDIKKLFHSIQTRHFVKINWTKAHVGTTGNERADFLAKEATKHSLPDLDIGYCRRELRRLLHLHTLESWQEKWQESTKGPLTHEFFPSISETRLISDRRLAEMVTGHGPFPSYKKHFDPGISGDCACSAQNADAKHYLLYCPLTRARTLPFRNNRQTLHDLNIPDDPTTVTQLKNLSSFLHDNFTFLST